MFAPSAPSTTRPSCAATPRPATRAGSWRKERRAVARIEATQLGLDIRFIVTNLDHGSPEWIYESLYCARGQAENLIKLHKTQLASDRTSCRSALANQARLVLHTAAYWLMLTVRDAIPDTRDFANAEFATLRLHLLKIAARVVEIASRVRLAFAAACPEAELFASCPPRSCRAGLELRGLRPSSPSPIPQTRSQSAGLLAVKKPKDQPRARTTHPQRPRKLDRVTNRSG